MNKTQKGAWFTLGVAILLAIFGAIICAALFAPGSRAARVGLVKGWAWFIMVFVVGGAAFVHWKRKPSNVDFDERDNAIKKNAVLVSFVSLWALLIAASLIPNLIVGDDGAIPVCFLPVINFGVFLIVMLIYSLAVLFQYGLTSKGEKS